MNTSYLKKLYHAKCAALALEVQELIDYMCKQFKIKPYDAKQLAYEQTNYLRKRILAMPSTQMYFDELKENQP